MTLCLPTPGRAQYIILVVAIFVVTCKTKCKKIKEYRINM